MNIICPSKNEAVFWNVKRSGKLGALIAAVCLSIALTLLIPRQTFAHADTVCVYQTVLIEKDDTLWDFAVRYSAEGQDIRSYIQEVRSLNHLSSDRLIEGEHLILPIQKSPYDLTYR